MQSHFNSFLSRHPGDIQSDRNNIQNLPADIQIHPDNFGSQMKVNQRHISDI